MTLDMNAAVYALFGLQVLGLGAVGWVGWRIARGPVRDATTTVKTLTTSGKRLTETGKNLASLGAQAKSIGESAKATKNAVGLAPPPAGMLLTPQRLLQGIGLARTARTALKTRKLPKKKPSLALQTATRLGLVPPAAKGLLKAFGIGKIALGVVRQTRRK
jgi:hypothetical protein